ncbi:hypothetical protein COCON_G00117150 [Conger conger]|uniref:Uncharacterized protein n=1 Tax=Conger conger TaxID=82655 RepID=A0A9Q1HWL8_CONCO|nr:hypothetical protein COCON_G00117150 [Conger conger]
MSNMTTADSNPIIPGTGAQFILIPVLVIMGLLLALGIWIKRRQRNKELRHRLIPLIRYRHGWHESDDDNDGDEYDDEALKEPLRSDSLTFDGRLTFHYSSNQ